jgi:phosphatidyl-myo-inositol dimannoside synthase
MTHGHEVGWAALPLARNALRRIALGCDVITYLTEYQRERLAPVVGGSKLKRLTPGVDVLAYNPSVDGGPVRERHGLTERPVIVCVSRLVPRKGQDMLIRALPLVRKAVPDVALLLVGGGPHRDTLRKLILERGLAHHVVLTGSVPWPELPAHYAAGDVFAMPCRTRSFGLDVEGLGIVYLEASATGLPVVAGDSGGAPDAVLEGETGFVVPGRDIAALADRLVTLLKDPGLARKMGAAGREWTQREWTWDRRASQLRALLAG